MTDNLKLLKETIAKMLLHDITAQDYLAKIEKIHHGIILCNDYDVELIFALKMTSLILMAEHDLLEEESRKAYNILNFVNRYSFIINISLKDSEYKEEINNLSKTICRFDFDINSKQKTIDTYNILRGKREKSNHKESIDGHIVDTILCILSQYEISDLDLDLDLTPKTFLGVEHNDRTDDKYSNSLKRIFQQFDDKYVTCYIYTYKREVRFSVIY